ncbi:hypothetical protein BDV10DRAFT_186189 [Aspergillus recurvatus]
MAEVLGVAASAVGLFGLLGNIFESIEKLKALRSFVKTIPQELQDLIEDVETVQCLLQNFTPEMYSILDIPLSERRLSKFRTELEIMIGEVQKYQISTTSRRIGAVKLALKKEEIRERKRNLDNIKSTLMLLQQTYLSVCFRELGPIMCAKKAPASTTGQVVEEEATENEDRQTSKHATYRTRKTIPWTTKGKNWEVQFRTPLIVIDKIWNLQLRRALSGWTFTIRTNNVIPCNAPIITACLEGDLEDVQRLFLAGLATPHDCDENGWSLLMIATRCRRLQLCRMLLENGADPDHKNKYGFGALQCASFAAKRWIDYPKLVPLIVDLFRLIINVSKDCHDPFEELELRELRAYGYRRFDGFNGPPEALTMIQQYTFDNYATLPLSVRLERAMALNEMTATPSMLEIAMGGSTDPATIHLRNERGETLLDRIVQWMGWNFGCEQIDRAIEWRPLLKDAMVTFADLYSSLIAIFLTGFSGNWRGSQRKPYRDWRRARRMPYDLNPIIRIWATELKLAGVDLETYGAKERLFNRTRGIDLGLNIWFNYSLPKHPSGCYELLPFRIIDISYGPDPEDWRIWVTNPSDTLVGDFWEMIEREKEVMPGTWVE